MYENKLPLTTFTVINNPNPANKVNIQVEARRVKLDDAVTPLQNNAWCYVKVSGVRPPGTATRANYLGPIFNVQSGVPCTVRFINTLGCMMGMPEMQEEPPINPPPMAPDMQPSVGIAAHLHGGKVPHNADGWPLAPASYVGNPYGFPVSLTYTYPNQQRAAMLWFHDHAMDNTAPQVFAGLAGLYFVRDASDTAIFSQIGGAAQEIPLVIQDRNLECGYDAVDYWAGIPTDAANPALAPDGYVRPEFLGETLFVNGRATPYHNVNRAVYRLRILNGSNARTYALALIDPFWWAKSGNSSRVWYSDCLWVIGNEAGLISQSAALNATDYVLLAPGERLDVLLDLTGAGLANLDCLRLVNLAVASAKNDPGLEGIYQTDALSVLAPLGAADTTLNNALKLGQANIMQFCLTPGPAALPINVAAVDGILSANANDEGFVADALGVLGPNPANALGTTVARNRFVLLMNNTGNPTVNPLTAWKDTQMWELGAPDGVAPTWQLPFSIDTAAANPVAGGPAGQTGYGVYRATFFAAEPPPPINPATGYPAVHAPTFSPVAGTYERWYVANVGNAQPLVDDLVDMHPFHMHLVNFVVQRRWTLDAAGSYALAAPRPLDFDGISRHDTLRVQSGELVELLVYFPPGYTGDYVYHCHLVEHEDMGMMLHFSVV